MITAVAWLAYGADLPDHILYLHPRPDAEDVSYQTGLIIRFDPALADQISSDDFSISVAGETSGPRQGSQLQSGNNVLFQLVDFYIPGEIVHVTLACEELGWTAPCTYQFSVNPLTNYSYLYKPASQTAPDPPPSLSKTTVGEMTTMNGVTVPSDFPLFEPEILTPQISPGKLFINNWNGVHYIMVLENDGTPYFYQRVQSMSRDFKVQPNGELSRHMGDRFMVMDSSCNITRYIESAHGYLTDEHEFQLLPDGHYFLIAVGNRIVDMSRIVSNGYPEARVKDTHIQEFDENGNIIFEWLAQEHLDIEDATHLNLTNSKLDYSHMNSLAIDYDGHIIASVRNFNQIIKINRHTGDIIWRLGGLKNEFEFVNDEYQTAYQHDVRPVPGKPNHYTAFDNGNFRSPRFSRAVEFSLDTTLMTATKVWEYRLPNGSTEWLGNAQRLPNGNTHINWADSSVPKATEVTPEGDVVYQADFVTPNHSYRTFRFDWEYVMEKPCLIAESMPSHINLIFNKFGDNSVKEYRVYAGEKGRSLQQIAVTKNTFYQITQNDVENNRTYSFRVKAVLENGKVSPNSNTVDVKINLIDSENNIIENGNFTDGYEAWNWGLFGSADATSAIDTDNRFHFRISDGGSAYYHVQLKQNGIPLFYGLTYIFEFDAHADAPRPFEVKLLTDGDPYTDYSKIGLTALSTRKKHFSYEFVMKEASDTNTRLELNAGLYNTDVYVTHISLKRAGETDTRPETGMQPDQVAMIRNYPNPFNASAILEYRVAEQSRIKISVFNTRGERIRELVNSDHTPGRYTTELDGTRLSTGLYIYIMSVTVRHKETVQKTGKMMLLK